MPKALQLHATLLYVARRFVAATNYRRTKDFNDNLLKEFCIHILEMKDQNKCLTLCICFMSLHNFYFYSDRYNLCLSF